MLGCCSERAILLLIESYINAIDDEKNQNKLKSRISKRDISFKYNEFNKSFNTIKKSLGMPGLINDYDVHVESIFNFIRLLRNSIVHPESLPNITNSIAYSNLQQFSYYVETVFKLITYFESNQIAV